MTAVPQVQVAGVYLHDVSRADFFARFDGGVVFPVNVDMIMRAHRDPQFHTALHAADWRLCDSQIALAAARFLGTPIREKISGSDALGEFCAHHRSNPAVRLFLLGADPGVAAEAGRRINRRIGREIVVGSHSPSYGFERDEAEQARIVELIRQSGATALAVGLGVPKQEYFILRQRHAMPGVRMFFAVGATLDFESGNIARAPAWMSRNGLEWAFRLMREPKRLWRRYLVDDTPFLWLVLLQRLGLSKQAGGRSETV